MVFLAGVVATAAIASGAAHATASYPSPDTEIDLIWAAIDAGSLTTFHRTAVPGETEASAATLWSGVDQDALALVEFGVPLPDPWDGALDNLGEGGPR